MEPRTYYVTTPIYYVNDMPHIGHVYTTVVADVIARYKRLMGYDVYFLTGTDEHGQKVEKAAADAGMQPIQLADKVVQNYEKLWPELNISNDDFIRTTQPRHEQGAAKLFQLLLERGDIYLDRYKGQYCVSCEAFQTQLQAKEGKCPDCGKPLEEVEEESYFFKLSKYEKKLLAFYEEHPEFIQPEHRRNEVISFVKSGLKDLSVSRTSFKWGIPVPENEKHVMYVWLDALSNYITALGYPETEDNLYSKYWPADLHLIGKDILRFHAVYWPAFLMAAELPLPKTVFAHGWWLKDKAKMSKSVGNVVRPQYLMKDFGTDAVRYFLIREMVFGLDSSFSDEAFLQRLNADLVNDLGNLLSRTLGMIDRYCGGEIPEPDVNDERYRKMESRVKECAASWESDFDTFQLHRAMEEVWSLLSDLNKFIVENEPWTLAKDADQESALRTVLYVVAEAIRLAALMVSPVMPTKAQEIWDRLGFEGKVDDCVLSLMRFGSLKAGSRISNVKEHLFARVDVEEYMKETDGGEKGPGGDDTAKEEASTMDNLITIDDFAKVELKVAKILEAEKVEKSNKLIRMKVTLGDEDRQIVAGIALKYAPEDLVGRKIIVVANLKPAKLMGIESQGMLLAASGPEGTPFLLSVDDEAEPGFRIK